MPGRLLDGRSLSIKIKEDIKKDLSILKSKYGKCPKLVGVQVGENKSSEIYLRSQIKASDELGIDYKLEKLDANITQHGLMRLINSLNADDSVNGIILQMPLPPHINHKQAFSSISPKKDAEAMHPENLGNIILGENSLRPCTAASCMELLNSIQGLDLYGKEAVIIGHSEIVGKPLALMLLNRFVTTTVCHIATSEKGMLQEYVERAEILVVACGKACLVKGSWIKEGAIVIDVGVNKLCDKIVGDVEFDKALERAGFITPVPGGVGPLTVTMLMKNLVEIFKLQI